MLKSQIKRETGIVENEIKKNYTKRNTEKSHKFHLKTNKSPWFFRYLSFSHDWMRVTNWIFKNNMQVKDHGCRLREESKATAIAALPLTHLSLSP